MLLFPAPFAAADATADATGDSVEMALLMTGRFPLPFPSLAMHPLTGPTSAHIADGLGPLAADDRDAGGAWRMYNGLCTEAVTAVPRVAATRRLMSCMMNVWWNC